jgi:diguanylate cyclase (GGDEF)-like protein
MNILLESGKKINNHLENKHKSVSTVLGFFFFVIITYIDYQVTLDISLSFFYLLPVSLMTWFISKEAGFLTAFLSAIAWLIVNYPSHQTESGILVHAWNAAIVFLFLFTVSYLIYKLRKAKEKEQESARIDPITGLANKRLFFELARLEVKKVDRYRHPLTVIYIDIDDFKKINDIFGYRVGDKLLQIVAETIKISIRETDIIARIGGDEFIILLPGNGYEPANIVIRRVHKQLLRAMQDNEWLVTFSIGAATYIHPPKSVDDMIQRADHLMYLAKNNGKNQLKHITSI